MQILVLASLVVFAAGSHWPWDPWSSRHSGHGYSSAHSYTPDPNFSTSAQDGVNDIKRLLINIERKMQDFCRRHTDTPLREAYGANHYRLYVNLTGCGEDGVEVRAGQRLVAVQAKDSRCDYVALRLLPDAVDSNSAYWRFENGQLNILFPYSSDRRRCGRVISDSVHSLPKFDKDTPDPDFEVKLGEADSESTLGMYSSDHVVQRSGKNVWDD